MVGAVALRAGRVFMARRGPGGSHSGLWEFPGGKVEPGEGDAEALVRELREELGVHASVGALVAVGRDRAVALWCYRCTWEGPVAPALGQAVRWVPLDQLGDVDVPPADRATVQALIGDRTGVW